MWWCAGDLGGVDKSLQSVATNLERQMSANKLKHQVGTGGPPSDTPCTKGLAGRQAGRRHPVSGLMFDQQRGRL